jgi:hypothetical protein
VTSLADDLAELDARAFEHSTKVLDVPGRGGRLCVRYRAPRDRDRLTPILAAHSTEGALSGDEELQLLVDCCDEVMRRSDPDAEPESYEGGPLRFDGSDPRWGLGDKATARDCVRKLFGTDKFPLAPSRHANALVDFLQGIEIEVALRVEGKSGSGEETSPTQPESSSAD